MIRTPIQGVYNTSGRRDEIRDRFQLWKSQGILSFIYGNLENSVGGGWVNVLYGQRVLKSPTLNIK